MSAPTPPAPAEPPAVPPRHGPGRGRLGLVALVAVLGVGLALAAVGFAGGFTPGTARPVPRAAASAAAPVAHRSPVATGDPAVLELDFLYALQQHGVSYASPSQAVAVGHLACSALVDGAPLAEVVAATRTYGTTARPGGYSSGDATAIVEAAAAFFCPGLAPALPAN